MASTSPLWSRGQLLAAALLFSTGGVAIKACGLGDWQIASYRCGVGALALVAFLPAARRGWTWRAWAVGAAYAGTLVCFALANKATTSANAIFLQSSAPLYILALSPWLLRERIRARDLAVMATLAAGLVLFFVGTESPTATAPDPLRGNLLGLSAGVFWAATVLGLRWLASAEAGDASLPALVAGNVIGFVVGLPMALQTPPAFADTVPSDWLWLGYLGVFQIGLAYVFLTRGLRRVPAFEASILLLAEPVINPVWSYFGHGEVPSALSLGGACLILAATVGKTVSDLRAGSAPSDPAVPDLATDSLVAREVRRETVIEEGAR